MKKMKNFQFRVKQLSHSFHLTPKENSTFYLNRLSKISFSEAVGNIKLKNKKTQIHKINNFHRNYLRESIHKNQYYQNLFIPNEKLHKKVYSSSPLRTTQSTDFFSKHSKNSGDKEYTTTQHSFFFKTKPNKISLHLKTEGNAQKSRNFENVIQFLSSPRAESLTEFNKKIKDITKEKYANYYKNNTYQKIQTHIQNNVDLVDLDINNLSTSFSLLKSFSKENDLYIKYLIKTKNKLIDQNENLKQIKNKLFNEIQRIRNKQFKLQKLVQENIKNKYFLMCVKNSTTDVSKFSEIEQQERRVDELILHSVMNSQINYISESIEEQEKREVIRSEKRKMTMKFTRKGTKKLSYLEKIAEMPKKKEFSNVPFHLLAILTRTNSYLPFDSPDDFLTHLNNITIRINNSLKKYNENLLEIQHLKQERKQMSLDTQKSSLIYNEIEECKQKLEFLKEKHRILLEYQNSTSDKKQKLSFIEIKILSMYNYFHKSNKTNSANINILQCLKFFDLFLHKLLIKSKEYKEKMQNEYDVQNKRIEKKNKLNLLKLQKDIQKRDYSKKIQKIIENSRKIIIRPKRHIEINIKKVPKHKINVNSVEIENILCYSD